MHSDRDSIADDGDLSVQFSPCVASSLEREDVMDCDSEFNPVNRVTRRHYEIVSIVQMTDGDVGFDIGNDSNVFVDKEFVDALLNKKNQT